MNNKINIKTQTKVFKKLRMKNSYNRRHLIRKSQNYKNNLKKQIIKKRNKTH